MNVNEITQLLKDLDSDWGIYFSLLKLVIISLKHLFTPEV